MYGDSFKEINGFNADDYKVGEKIKINVTLSDSGQQKLYEVILDFKKGKKGGKYFILIDEKD